MKITLKLSNPFILSLATILLSCYKQFDPKEQSFPLIRTLPVTNNDGTGVQFNGEVIKPGTDPVADRGFIWAKNKSAIPGPDTFLISLGTDLKQNFSVRVSHKLVILREYQVKAFVAISNKTVYGDVINFTSKMTSPTRITSFSPSQVLDADTLTIFGDNFNEIAADEVTIAGNSADVLSFRQTSVTVKVPAIPQAGQVSVVVNAFFETATSNLLTILNPSIASFSPTRGSSGQLVTLNGRFSNDRFSNKVFFNGVGAELISSTRSQLTVYVPYGISGNAGITIDIHGKAFTTTDLFVVQ
jgi:hypothetical protein